MIRTLGIGFVFLLLPIVACVAKCGCKKGKRSASAAASAAAAAAAAAPDGGGGVESDAGGGGGAAFPDYGALAAAGPASVPAVAPPAAQAAPVVAAEEPAAPLAFNPPIFRSPPIEPPAIAPPPLLPSGVVVDAAYLANLEQSTDQLLASLQLIRSPTTPPILPDTKQKPTKRRLRQPTPVFALDSRPDEIVSASEQQQSPSVGGSALDASPINYPISPAQLALAAASSQYPQARSKNRNKKSRKASRRLSTDVTENNAVSPIGS